MKVTKQISRRDMLTGTAALGSFSFLPARVLGRAGAILPSEKVNLGFIGVAGHGLTVLTQFSSQNIVAMCDVDWRSNSAVSGKRTMPVDVVPKYPRAKRFDDWRVMLEKMDKSIDAVVVCTPDHTHAHPSIAAMKMGKHVFCEKPLAHSIYEVRAMMAAERKYRVSTQMGIQGHATEDCRMIVEWIRDGAIGTVKEVHVFQVAPPRPAIDAAYYEVLKHIHDDIPIPPELKWDLWIGPAPYRPFNPMYAPGHWRQWVDFGTGMLGDHGPHYLDPACWALDLGLPETIEAEADPEYDPRENDQIFPRTSTVRYRFAARGKLPAVSLTWWHGNQMPPAPKGWKPEDKLPAGGGIIVGSKGAIVHGTIFGGWRGTPGVPVPGQVKLVPEELDKSYKRPDKTLPRVQSHWLEWVECLKARKPASANFGYGGMVTEIALLGNIAIRNKGKILRFDTKKGNFTNSDEANKLLQRPYREGWTR